ncbi:PfkB family carbohydrate kinase [Sphingomonas sp.]|uniref:PfkB family carbohydrate kinase n=1 Tax=Sphingomonas sp. TaxID=28214 RepID=UPI003AFF62A8
MDSLQVDLLGEHTVAIIGDLMIDCYLNGDVRRISPEAPVPVLRASSQRIVPGGAANVVANLAALGARVRVVGLVGEDEMRGPLIDAMTGFGAVDCAGVVASASRRTTQKLRIVCDQQQIVRVDHEDEGPLSRDDEERCVAAALSAIADAEVVVVSDYGKGVCSDRLLRAVLDRAAGLGKPVLVDPKRRDLSGYRGATILTPNRKELADATGLPCETDAEAQAAAEAAQAVCGAAILLTRSEKGMSYFPVNEPPLHLATVAQEVFDVSGAGDTVVAVIAAAMAAKLPVSAAIRMANHGAGIVVSKRGTATVTRDELAASLAAETSVTLTDEGRLVDLEEAVALRWAWHREKLTVGFANGCFDLLHPGHVSLIRQAAAACDRLIVALNSDASVRRLKGPTRPVQDERARTAVMGGLRGVSAVILFDEDTPLDAIRALQPDVLVKGEDYTEDKVVGASIVKDRGGQVVLARLSEGHSTSRLVARAADAPDPVAAERMPAEEETFFPQASSS